MPKCTMQISVGAALLIELMYVPIDVAYGVGVDEAVNGTIQGIEGDSLTLTCDLRDIDPDFIWFSNSVYFLTVGESITARLPSNIANRIAVDCSEFLEACYLTLDPVRRTDAGQYCCGYQDVNGNNRVRTASGYLVVVFPPADTSPECILSKNSVPISSDTVQVGDQVALTCTVSGGDPRPSLYIARDGVPINQALMGSFTEIHTLSQQDEGSTFTCVMTHPALSQPRTCTLLNLQKRGPTLSVPLHSPESTSTMSTDVRKTYETPTISNSERLPTLSLSSESSQPLSTLSIALIIVVILLLIIICSIISVLIWRKKLKKTNQDSTQSMSTQNDRSNHQTDQYLELNADTEKHEYEKLKTKSSDASVNMDNSDDHAYANPSEEYEVAAVHDEYESVERGQEYSEQPFGVSYANLQRPVKAHNFNVSKMGDK